MQNQQGNKHLHWSNAWNIGIWTKKGTVQFDSEHDEEECENAEESYLAIDKMGKTTDDRLNIDAMADDHAWRCVKGEDMSERIKKKSKSKEEEVKSALKEKREEEEERNVHAEREEESESVESLHESDWDWDSSDDESEDEPGESLDKLFDS